MGWISVKDELPEVGVPVFLGSFQWPRGCIGMIPVVGSDFVGFLDETEALPEGDPTHWQALPEMHEIPAS